MSIISLHYYFPWAIKALVKWSLFCTITGRRARIDPDTRRYFDIGDRDDMTYDEKLTEYRRLADDYFDIQRYHEFCEKYLPDIDEVMVDYVESPQFDALLVETVRATFPAHEHDKFVPHYRGLLAAWARDQRAHPVGR
jgi:hypothetical protein